MKVSKIMLASLLGAIAINSVMADEYDGPRNRCKAKSDKHWVEKTKECIPANPCDTNVAINNPDVYRKYCADFIMSGRLSKNQEKMVYDKYVEQVLKTRIVEQTYSTATDLSHIFYGFTLLDGGYIVFQQELGFRESDKTPIPAFEICNAYGKGTCGDDCCLGDFTDSQCIEIATFASTLTGKTCNGTIGTYSCNIKCDE